MRYATHLQKEQDFIRPGLLQPGYVTDAVVRRAIRIVGHRIIAGMFIAGDDFLFGKIGEDRLAAGVQHGFLLFGGEVDRRRLWPALVPMRDCFREKPLAE